MAEHKYAQVLRWIADGENVEGKTLSGKSWCSVNEWTDMHLRRIINGDEGYEFRLAPRTITVNGVEVPAPEREAPKIRVNYYTPDLTECNLYFELTWYGDEIDLRLLERGLVYLNKEDAIARAKAMLIVKEG